VQAAGRQAAPHAGLRAARVAVTAYFCLFGVIVAVWITRIPAIKERLHLSDGVLGIALFAIPAGLLLVILVAGRLVDRIGSARVTRGAGVGMALFLIPPGLAGSLAALMAALFVFGTVMGSLDVSMNANGALVERARGRPVMSSLHAGYSIGALVGAVLGGLFAGAGIGPLPTFLIVGLPAAVVAAVAGRWLITEQAARQAAGRDAAGPAAAEPALAAGTGAGAAADPGRTTEPAGADQGPAGIAQEPGSRRGGRPGRPAALILLLGTVGLCALLVEGSAADWSAVYLHDNLSTSAGFAAVGFAAFALAMTAGRLLGDRLKARFGTVRLVRGSGLVAAAGLAGGLISGDPVGGVIGFAVLGAGLACIVPQVFLAGAAADPARPGHGLARVVGMSYLGMVSGPVLIGGAATLAGLRIALGIPVLLSLGVAALAGVLSPRAPAPETAPGGSRPATG
jgi:MFS family permease